MVPTDGVGVDGNGCLGGRAASQEDKSISERVFFGLVVALVEN